MTTLTIEQFQQARREGLVIEYCDPITKGWKGSFNQSFPTAGLQYRIKPEQPHQASQPPTAPKHAEAGTPHVHAAVIKAWADGAEIEVRTPSSPTTFTDWHMVRSPTWCDEYQYRVKPPREFPKSSLGVQELWHTYYASSNLPPHVCKKEAERMIQYQRGDIKAVADAAIIQYILDSEADKA